MWSGETSELTKDGILTVSEGSMLLISRALSHNGNVDGDVDGDDGGEGGEDDNEFGFDGGGDDDDGDGDSETIGNDDSATTAMTP